MSSPSSQSPPQWATRGSARYHRCSGTVAVSIHIACFINSIDAIVVYVIARFQSIGMNRIVGVDAPLRRSGMEGKGTPRPNWHRSIHQSSSQSPSIPSTQLLSRSSHPGRGWVHQFVVIRAISAHPRCKAAGAHKQTNRALDQIHPHPRPGSTSHIPGHSAHRFLRRSCYQSRLRKSRRCR